MISNTNDIFTEETKFIEILKLQYMFLCKNDSVIFFSIVNLI